MKMMHMHYDGEGTRYNFSGAKRAKPRKRSKIPKERRKIVMAKAKKQRKPATFESVVSKISVILAGLSAEDQKRAVSGARKLLRVAKKLSAQNGAK